MGIRSLRTVRYMVVLSVFAAVGVSEVGAAVIVTQPVPVPAFATEGFQIAQAATAAEVARNRAAQQALAAARFDPGPIDGVIGLKTRDAIRKFQEARKLAPSGYLDANTLTALGVR